MFEQFKAKAEAVGAEVHRFATRGEALDHVLRIVQGGVATSGGTAVWASCRFLSGLDVAGLARNNQGLCFEVTREAAAAASIGITEAQWGLADTGTLVADQTPVEQRLASTLPPVHVALVGTGQILPDKRALLGRIDPRTSGYLAFITGPSRTADIERVLTIGVHGPKRLIVVCVDELKGVSA